MKKTEILTNGLVKENPVLRLVLGTCPTLAVTTAAMNGIGMGLAATFVLICSNVVISACRKIIPDKVHIPAFITIIAGFVSVVQMLVKAYAPALDSALGVYLPLIVVNCIILGRAEAYASKNAVLPSAVDGLVMGLGFTFALVLMGFFRELLGAGTFLSGLSTLLPFLAGVIPAEGFAIPFFNSNPMVMMILPAGGFLMLGFIFAAIQKIMAGKEDK